MRSMLRIAYVATCALAAFSCGTRIQPERTLRTCFDPADASPIVDSYQIWHLGLEYLEPTDVPRPWTDTLSALSEDFTGLTAGHSTAYLKHPAFHGQATAVQFSCAVNHTPYEWALERALVSDAPERQLQALILLVRTHAPRSVADQWRVVNDLREIDNGPLWHSLLTDVRSAFGSARLLRELARDPPRSPVNSGERVWHWSVRAAGITKLCEAIPRLSELARSQNIHASLTAQRTLLDFQGPEANEALAACVRAWRYNASDRAAEALEARDPELLLRTLRGMGPPTEGGYRYAMILGRLGQPNAVPLLCGTVPNAAMVDGDMFALIRRLARPEHLGLIEDLLGQVREGQREAARSTIDAVRHRLGTQSGAR